jgi:predicted flap endonuclease-1-like 5' DNA nuclease
MNILIIFVAGISVGWVAEKLYHSCARKGQSSDDGIVAKEVIVEDPKKAKAKVKAKDAVKIAEVEGVPSDTTDDFSQLKGVGPKLADALDKIGIYNYKQLSSSSIDMLLERLKETGGRFTRPSISSIVEQAKLAAQYQ